MCSNIVHLPLRGLSAPSPSCYRPQEAVWWFPVLGPQRDKYVPLFSGSHLQHGILFLQGLSLYTPETWSLFVTLYRRGREAQRG